MPRVEQRLQLLEDNEAIRDLAARFADSTTRADYESFAALWALNATFVINKPFFTSATGTEAILAMLHKLRNGRDFFVTILQWEGAPTARTPVALGAIGDFTVPINGGGLLTVWTENGK